MEKLIKEAFIAGYEQGHNDTVESGYGCSTDKADEYYTDISNLVEAPVMQKAVEDEERKYNELFNELNKNFTAYNWFITTNPNSDEAKKRWDKIREIINRFSA